MADQLAVGIVLTTDPEQTRKQLATFCRALEEATGLAVKLHKMWPYHQLLEALRQDEVNLAWLPPTLALEATKANACVPVALPVRHGISTYSTALFGRDDGSVQSVAELEGVRAAWVDERSASGYLLIRAKLRSLGVDLAKAFASNTFYRRHDAVATAVLSGEADVGATFVHLDESSGDAIRAGWGDQPTRIICSAGPIPNDFVAVSKSLPDNARAVVQQALVSGAHAPLLQAANELLGCDSFASPVPEHVAALFAMLESHGPADSRQGHRRVSSHEKS